MKKLLPVLLLMLFVTILTPQHLYAQESKDYLLGEKSLTEGSTVNRSNTNITINGITSDLLELTTASLMDLGDGELRIYADAYTFDIVDEIYHT